MLYLQLSLSQVFHLIFEIRDRYRVPFLNINIIFECPVLSFLYDLGPFVQVGKEANLEYILRQSDSLFHFAWQRV